VLIKPNAVDVPNESVKSANKENVKSEHECAVDRVKLISMRQHCIEIQSQLNGVH